MRAFFIVFPILALIGLVIFHGGWAMHWPDYDAGIWLHPVAGVLLALFFSLGLRFSFFGSMGWIILAAVGWEIFELAYYTPGRESILELLYFGVLENSRDILGTVISGTTILLVLKINTGREDDHEQS